MFTCDDGGHHGSEHEEQLIEEEQSSVVINAIGVIADLPVEQSHQNGDQDVSGEPEQRQHLHQRHVIKQESRTEPANFPHSALAVTN